MEYKREITIGVPLEKARLFIREVKNLPIWTRFFKRCISFSEISGKMETPLGTSQTSIKEEQVNSSIKLLICSIFHDRQEHALLILEGDQQQANVTFHLKIPPTISEEQQKRIVSNLEEELLILKQHLESNYA